MCRGSRDQQAPNQPTSSGFFCSSGEILHVSSSHVNSSGFVSCELCGSRASLYCQADDAFLCRKCDKWVHEANFLALRHIRCFLCNSCQNLTRRYLVGVSVEVNLPTILRWMERTRCDYKVERNSSRNIPPRTFQFL
ncbi:hypothetical protein ACOSQ2_002615 [Xanthoceras sorbifolium]|uniref:B box-type domain-containing protein n=1 Tax=Xanthoceras sorbifolium TaxID=99658 RepID=A0ABQ8IK88_9ROSI|nr:hypothetical protein JRO89_XS01G0149900 [Xanthoceras sorbifolium]